MSSELIFATNNQNKVLEIKAVAGGEIAILSLKEAGILKDIPEPFDTLEENAREKCRVIHELTGKNCFSEDTGLEVASLNGAPGVRSARFAGEEADAEMNTAKLLEMLKPGMDRSARFRTVICLVLDGKEYFFEGVCPGKIITAKKGSFGFGYDPVFIPEGSDRTFAEMSIEEKNIFSHRKKAMAALVLFLQKNKNP